MTEPMGSACGGASGACRLADLALEWFDDVAVVFVIDDGRFVTLDRSGGELLEYLRANAASEPLRPAALARLLASHYALEPDEAADAARDLLAAWSCCGLFTES